jgi:hypothetical protein
MLWFKTVWKENHMSSSSQRAYKRPNPYKRAIAEAIELEKTHDVMARIIGHSIPIENRITDEPRDKRKLKLNLPKTRGKNRLEQLAALSEPRIEALSELHDEIGGTLSFSEQMLLTEIVEEMRENSVSRDYVMVPTRGSNRLLDPDDRMSVREKMYRDIERAADAPVPPSAKTIKTPANDQLSDNESFTIDLLTEGLLNYYNVNRTNLYNELQEHHRTYLRNKRSSYLSLASPSMMDNQRVALKSLGKSFPRAKLRLRGRSLDIEHMFFQADFAGETLNWEYMHSRGRMVLECISQLQGHDIFDYPRKALQDLTDDKRFHESIVISDVFREVKGIHIGSTSFVLMNGYAHIDPPHLNSALRMKPQRPSFVRETSEVSTSMKNLLALSTEINAMISEKGHTQRRVIKVKEGVGIQISIAAPGSDSITHDFMIKNETIRDGIEAVKARVDNIHGFIMKARDRNQRKAARYGLPKLPETETLPKLQSSILAPHVTDEEQPEKTPAEMQADGMQVLFESEYPLYEKAQKLDALLVDVLNLHQDIKEINVPILHFQENILAIKQMVLDNESTYRLEKFDRVMGKPTYAIANIETTKHLTPATIEALRDGSIKRLIEIYPEFAYSQVRKVTKCDDVTVITVRVQLEEKLSK